MWFPRTRRSIFQSVVASLGAYWKRARRDRRLAQVRSRRQQSSWDDHGALVQVLETRTMLTIDLGGTPTEQVADDASPSTTLGTRWSSTVTNGSGLGQGSPTTLTWSIADEGTPIGALGGIGGESTGSSNLVTFLGGIYGVVTNNTNYTDEPWFAPLASVFDRWSELTGITYVYEPNDDGAAFSANPATAPGVLGTRGDIRIGGHSIDGNFGVSAYNFTPNNGEMVIDTNDNFFADTSQNSLGLRNIVAHEAGHGIGLGHSESSDSNFLMEPVGTSDFDGPQFDDILGAQRHYGDNNGNNNTPGSAASLGSVTFGQTITVGADASDMYVDFSDTDFVSIDDDSELDFYSFSVSAAADIRLTLTPVGPTYLVGPQGGPEAAFNAKQQSDLTLELRDTNGTTVLATRNAAGFGGTEVVYSVLPGAGTYFVRVSGSANAAQMYQLDLIAKPKDGLVPFQRLDPLGGLISSSVSNFGNLPNASSQQDFNVFLERGQTLSAIVTPVSAVSLSVQVVGVSGTMTSAVAGAAVVLPTTGIPADGTYAIRVTTNGASDFTLQAFLNAAIEKEVGDSFNGHELDITDTLIQTGPARFGVLGASSGSVTSALEFVKANNPAAFIDISSTGNSFVLPDSSLTSITSTVGNAIFPSGVFSLNDDGGIVAGNGNFLPFSNSTLPSVLLGNALLPFWDDLNQATVYWEERLVGGIKTLIVQWEDRPHFDFGGAATFQVQLFESGPILTRYAYQDVVFGNVAVDGGASATIGYQASTLSALQFSFNTPSVVNGDVLDLQFVVAPDVDEYTIDLTGMAGQLVDVVLAGQNGVDFSGQTLELLDTNGTTVLATAAPDPALGGTNATNYDLGILGFTVPANGIYTIRVSSTFLDANYGIVVSHALSFDTEPNNSPSNPLRSLTTTRSAVGYLNAATDPDDYYQISLSLNDVVTFGTDTLFDNAATRPVNTLDPELQIIHPNGSTVVANSTNTAGDGKNAAVSFVAPTTGVYTFRVRATSGSGEYILKEVAAPVIGAFDTTVTYIASGTAVLLDMNATVTDVDTTRFNGGVLTVSLTANAEANDRFGIRQVTRLIDVNGTNVTYRGTTVGFFTGGPGVTPLVITFNASATVSAVQTVLRNITYRSVSSNPSILPRTVQVTLTDGTGMTSNLPTKTINVTAVPIPPVGGAASTSPSRSNQSSSPASGPFSATTVETTSFLPIMAAASTNDDLDGENGLPIPYDGELLFGRRKRRRSL